MNTITEEEALNRMAAYCSAAEHCKAEVNEKLQKWGLPYEVINRIIDRLVVEKFIDEERYCRAFVNDKFRFAKWGKMKITQALYMKKIPREVTYRYLNDIDREEYLAILGPSSSGKSTLMKLCARFYDPDKGVILLGNKNIREIDPEKLMQRISMVFQDVYLFQDTIKNNIRFGKENATDNEIIEAAKKAQCHDFIIHLPQGYDTMIGEGGCTLSGGEKQRISIARAILKDAPVILLDEATASLDPENEVEIQYAINSLIQGRTVIVIAHKLKTISDADKIIVLSGGEVTAVGTKDEVMPKLIESSEACSTLLDKLA